MAGCISPNFSPPCSTDVLDFRHQTFFAAMCQPVERAPMTCYFRLKSKRGFVSMQSVQLYTKCAFLNGLVQLQNKIRNVSGTGNRHPIPTDRVPAVAMIG